MIIAVLMKHKRFIRYKGLLKNQSVRVHREISPGAAGIGLGQAGCENHGVACGKVEIDRGLLHNRAMKRRCAKYRVAREAACLNSICDQLHNHDYRWLAKWRSKAENTLLVSHTYVSGRRFPIAKCCCIAIEKKKVKLWKIFYFVKLYQFLIKIRDLT